MKTLMKRSIVLFLSLTLLLEIFQRLIVPVPIFAEEIETSDQYEQIDILIEDQIRNYAESINRKDSSDDAAWALARHGIAGKGKKLSVGDNHALTATLMNSKLGLATVIRGCKNGIKTMQQLELVSVFDDAGCNWNASGNKQYVNTIVEKNGEKARLNYTNFNDYTGALNENDQALIWMVGWVEVHSTITQEEVTKDEIIYNVSVAFEDRFDFNTSSGSAPHDIASIIGSFLFKGFDWTATAEFKITIPNSCQHSFADHYWQYDEKTGEMISVTNDTFVENKITKYSHTDQKGNIIYYYGLDRPVVLRHEIPWVLEYTVKNPGDFVIAPTQTSHNSYPGLVTHNTTHLFFEAKDISTTPNSYHCYGYTLSNEFQYSNEQTYRVRLENVVDANSDNMIFLSVYNNDLQTMVLNPSPMDDYYKNNKGVLSMQDPASRYLNGKDLYVNYIGNIDYGFSADHFELKIWENGINNSNRSYFIERYVKPACAEKEYLEYTCRHCGYSSLDLDMSSLNHNWSDWKVVKEPTYETDGLKERICLSCSYKEDCVIEKLLNEPIENPFMDVEQDTYYYDPVIWAFSQNITTGTSATEFSPEQKCTRAQIVTFLWRAMGCPEPVSTDNPFTDVELGMFYSKAVLWAVEKGITNGTSADKFGPEAECTRAQIVTFLWRAMGCPESASSENSFTDVELGMFYGKAVLWAVEKGITTGTGDEKFEPDTTCTRGQVVTFLYRAVG